MVFTLGGNIWFLVIAFQESVLSGILCLFMPFYALGFMIRNWDETKKPLGMTFTGALHLVSIALIPMLLASMGLIQQPGNRQALPGGGNNRFAIQGAPQPGGGFVPIVPKGNTFREKADSLYDQSRAQNGDLVALVEVSGLPANIDPGQGLSKVEVCKALIERMKALDPGIRGNALVVYETEAAFALWPVADPVAFAKRIDFGNGKFQGRRLQVQLSQQYLATVPRIALDLAQAPNPGNGGANDPQIPENADAVAKSLLQISSRDTGKKKEGLSRLERTKPDQRLDEVVEAIVPLLDLDDGFLVSDAIKTLAVWHNENATMKIIDKLIDTRFNVRIEAFKALGKIKDPRSVDPIVAALKENWPHADDALKRMGSVAEPGLIVKLKDPDSDLRRRACDLLKEIGGQDTLRAMADLPPDPDNGVKFAAQLAWTEIAKRVGVPADVEAKLKAKPKRKGKT